MLNGKTYPKSSNKMAGMCNLNYKSYQTYLCHYSLFYFLLSCYIEGGNKSIRLQKFACVLSKQMFSQCKKTRNIKYISQTKFSNLKKKEKEKVIDDHF